VIMRIITIDKKVESILFVMRSRATLISPFKGFQFQANVKHTLAALLNSKRINGLIFLIDERIDSSRYSAKVKSRFILYIYIYIYIHTYINIFATCIFLAACGSNFLRPN